MRCPNCSARMRKDFNQCIKCGTKIEDIKKASHLLALKARKEYQPDLVVYSTIFPSDLSYKKTLLLCIFLGWFGMHCYFVHRYFKAILLSCFSAVFLIFAVPLGSFLQTGDAGFLTDFMATLVGTGLYVFPCTLGAIAVLMWAFDILELCFKNFPVPVVLPEPEKKENQPLQNKLSKNKRN